LTIRNGPLVLSSGILVARRRYGIALIAIAIIAGVITAHYAMPMPDRLRVTLDEITDSDGLIPGTMVFESGGGNALCFDICPHVQRIYRVERQDLARTEALLRDRLVELGYRQANPGGTWTAGALQVSIDQEEADEFSGPVLIVGVEITDWLSCAGNCRRSRASDSRICPAVVVQTNGLSFQALTQARMSASRACTLRWSLRCSRPAVT